MAKIDAYYPPSPKKVPEDFAKPTSAYKWRVFMLLMTLLGAYGLYLVLLLGSLFLVLLPLLCMGSKHAQYSCVFFVLAVPSLLFFLFLVKGFFKRSQKDKNIRVEVTEEDQPLLFDFIERICDETGAKMPRHVYIVPEVNAAVMTYTGVSSLFWPTGKDLLIGLGLVNILNLSEFKSVLAHEFGHFAQRSTRLSGYVYTAIGVIHDIVFSRDWFDVMIEKMKRSWGTRNNNTSIIAVTGWVLFIMMWTLRKVLEGAFFLLILLHRSLSRQMEFNADLVAVSVAGSDAGIHALYKLTCCDAFYDQMWSDLRTAYQHKLVSADLFYHLNHAANWVRKQKDTRYGLPPQLAENPRDTPDIFEPEDSGTPKMWATHPSNYDREQNAKEYYIRCTIDDRSAWVVFKNPQKLREEITYRTWRSMDLIRKDEELNEPEEVQSFIDDEHAETTYDPRYHGLYDDRFILIDDFDNVVEEAKKAGWDAGRLDRVHKKLYDDELKEWMVGRKARLEEYQTLTGLIEGTLELKNDDLDFRGRTYDVRDAKRLRKKVDKELEEDRQFLEGIDRRVFLVYYQMASQADVELRKDMFRRWDFHVTSQDYLRKLKAERAHLQVVMDMANEAMSRSQGAGLQRGEFKAVLKACRDAQKSLKKVIKGADDLPLPELANMKKGKPLGHFLFDAKLVHSLDTDEDAISGEWIEALKAQLDYVLSRLTRIHFKSLGAILKLHDRVYAKWKEHQSAAPPVQSAAPAPAKAAAPTAPQPAARPAAPVPAGAQQTAAKLASATAPSKPAPPK